VIYCFFVLLLSYLGGERSLLILLHGRPPKEPVFPINIFKREIDVSDPYTFLFLKRGILREYFLTAHFSFILKLLSRCRIRPSQTYSSGSHPNPQSCWKIQRRRLPSQFRLSLCQYHLQHQYLFKPILPGDVLDLRQ